VSLFEALVIIQMGVMLLAGVFVYITGRDNKARDREYTELRERVETIEGRLWELHS
jgi:hypothetical protein